MNTPGWSTEDGVPQWYAHHQQSIAVGDLVKFASNVFTRERPDHPALMSGVAIHTDNIDLQPNAVGTVIKIGQHHNGLTNHEMRYATCVFAGKIVRVYHDELHACCLQKV